MNTIITNLINNAVVSRKIHNPKTDTITDVEEFDKRWLVELTIRECCRALNENIEVSLSASGDVVDPEEILFSHFGIDQEEKVDTEEE
jgi:hypothetical protein